MLRSPQLLIALAVLFCGCSAVRGRPSVAPVAMIGSEARHNIQYEVGARLRWPSGAECTLTGGQRKRVALPSNRGDAAENRIHLTIIGPGL